MKIVCWKLTFANQSFINATKRKHHMVRSVTLWYSHSLKIEVHCGNSLPPRLDILMSGFATVK